MEESTQENFGNFIDAFSYQIERHRNENKFIFYTDAIIDFLSLEETKKIYDFICLSNIQNFINENLKQKMFLEFSKKRMIKPRYSIKKTLW